MMGADYYEAKDSKEVISVGIGDGAFIDKAIVDKNARIGKNVTIKNMRNIDNFDGENYFIRDGIVIVPKGAIIKPGTKI
jgi:glucose-1-phosphate adenylyltransferase